MAQAKHNQPPAAFALAAYSLIGARFRLGGRDEATGLDCAGVIIAALRRIGRDPADPAGYGLRRLDWGPYLRFFPQAGFGPCDGPTQAGDVAVTFPGPGQLHLLVAAHGGGFVHAHAGLGRVVWSPASIVDPPAGCWRLPQN
jgi:hypothetical protein